MNEDIWRPVTKLEPGDIIELGTVVYDVLAVADTGQEIAVALQQRHRQREYSARVFGYDKQVCMCDPMEGIPLGMSKEMWEFRRANRDAEQAMKREVEAQIRRSQAVKDAEDMTDEEIDRQIRRMLDDHSRS